MSEEEYRQSAQRRSGGQGHGPGMRGFTGEKAKNGKKSLKDLFNYLKPYYVPIIVALVLAAASAVLM